MYTDRCDLRGMRRCHRRLVLEALCIAALWLLPTQGAQAAKPWPKLYEVTVKSTVTVEAGILNFSYWYSIYNSTRNEFPLYLFEVDVRADPGQHPLSAEHLTYSHGADAHADALARAERPKIVEQQSPPGWAAYRVGRWALGNDIDPDVMVRPGQTLQPFIIVAKEPPGIREERTLAYDRIWDDYGPADFGLISMDEFVLQTSKSIECLGKTLAPVAPPEPFTKEAWLQRIGSDVAEAHKLGWIRADEAFGQTRELLGKLQAAEGRKLKKTVREVEKFSLAQKKKGVFSDEADALVRLNALYLLRRLEGKP